jgi:hypothetical protein
MPGLFEKLQLLGRPWRPRWEHTEVRQAPQQDGHEICQMTVGMPGTEAKMKAQHIKGRVCLQVIQDEQKLFLCRIEVAFRTARRNLLDLSTQEPFLLDGWVGCREGYGEGIEF